MVFKVKFWGVRGSIACPQESHLGYGGNTSCVEVIVGGERIILDAGTGIRLCGKMLQDEGVCHATMLLSHTHLDHISGFPFFVPVYNRNFHLRVIATHLRDRGYPDIGTVLSWQMERPLFPIPLQALEARIVFQEFTTGESFFLNDSVEVCTGVLNHPDGATGYRINYNGRAFAYVTDTEHIPGQDDKNVLKLIDKADVIVYDATYTEEEFVHRTGWGHSTWCEGIRLARIAGVKRLFLFHHDPDHDDQQMMLIEREARSVWDNVFAAREGMTFTLDEGI